MLHHVDVGCMILMKILTKNSAGSRGLWNADGIDGWAVIAAQVVPDLAVEIW